MKDTHKKGPHIYQNSHDVSLGPRLAGSGSDPMQAGCRGRCGVYRDDLAVSMYWGLRFWAPIRKIISILGSILGSPHFWKLPFGDVLESKHDGRVSRSYVGVWRVLAGICCACYLECRLKFRSPTFKCHYFSMPPIRWGRHGTG